MDGITMGSAVLFGFNSRFSVATERTIWAVPEVTHRPTCVLLYWTSSLYFFFSPKLPLSKSSFWGCSKWAIFIKTCPSFLPFGIPKKFPLKNWELPMTFQQRNFITLLYMKLCVFTKCQIVCASRVLLFLKVTIGSVPDVGCHYHLNKKRSTGRWVSLEYSPFSEHNGSVKKDFHYQANSWWKC